MSTLKGVYVLVIQVDKDFDTKVGSLGKLSFKKGLYAYVGSAQNSIEQRIKRHLRKEKRKFWHIDYLLDNEAAKIVKVFYKQAAKTEECALAEKINTKGESIEGFGSSDCNCKTHLFQIKNLQTLQELMQATEFIMSFSR